VSVVIKFGGNAMVDSTALDTFIKAILELWASGVNPVVVHGGGTQISVALEKAGLVSQFKGGYRVTTAETVQIVRDVLVTEVNKEFVDLLNANQNVAIGLAGDVNNLLIAKQQKFLVDGVPTDIGFVGEVTDVDTAAINQALEKNLIPVISTAARDNSGQLLNVNADTATAAIAVALNAEQMIMQTDVPGLYRNWPDRDSLIETMNAAELETLLPNLQSGMVPKMQACLTAIRGGVPTVRVTGNLADSGTTVTAK